MAEGAELCDVAPEEQRDGPVDDDPQLPGEERQLVQMVRPREEPAEEAAQAQPEHVGDPLVASERRRLAEHAVAVGTSSTPAKPAACSSASRASSTHGSIRASTAGASSGRVTLPATICATTAT